MSFGDFIYGGVSFFPLPQECWETKESHCRGMALSEGYVIHAHCLGKTVLLLLIA